MAKYTFDGGRFALGFMVGLVATLGLLLMTDLFDVPWPFDETLIGAIIGALIAGIIGVAGQLIVIISDASLENRKSSLESRASLHRILTKAVRTLNTFLRFKEHVESKKLEDILVVGSLPSIIKPVLLVMYWINLRTR